MSLVYNYDKLLHAKASVYYKVNTWPMYDVQVPIHKYMMFSIPNLCTIYKVTYVTIIIEEKTHVSNMQLTCDVTSLTLVQW